MLPQTDARPWYTVGAGTLALGGVPLVHGDTIGAMLVDTGGPLTYVPAGFSAALIAAVIAAPGYESVFGAQTISDAACVTTSATPAELDAALPALTLELANAGGLTLSATRGYLYDAGVGTWCMSVVDGTPYGDDVALGDTWMASFVTVFDLVDQRIGFAPVVGCGDDVPSVRGAAASTLARIPWSHAATR
jgi:hypothetical protein